MEEEKKNSPAQDCDTDSVHSKASNASRASRKGPDRAPVGMDYHCLFPGCPHNSVPLNRKTRDWDHARRHGVLPKEIKFVRCDGKMICERCSQ